MASNCSAVFAVTVSWIARKRKEESIMLLREGNAFYEIDEACAAKKKLQEDEQQQKAKEKEKDVEKAP